VFVTDCYRNALRGRTVTVQTSNPSGYDTISYPSGQVTDTFGYCTAVFYSSWAGRDTVTATVSGSPGNTVTRIFFRNLESAMWNLEECTGTVTADNLGNNNTGALVNNPAWIDGVLGHSLSFGGTDDAVNVYHSDGIDVGKDGQSYTLEFWFRNSVIPPSDSHFLTKSSYNYPFSMVLINNGTVQFRMWDGTNNPAVTSVNNLSDGYWHYVVCVRDAANDRTVMYIDGNYDGQANDSTIGDISNTNPLSIGRSMGEDFSGALDEIRIGKYAMSAGDVKARHTGIPVPLILPRHRVVQL
jgi:hypothetical protein